MDCPHDDVVLVEGGYERTWTWDTSGDMPVAIFHGLEDFSDEGDGGYFLRCSYCLADLGEPPLQDDDDIGGPAWEWS
jgi:hypothetical protein